jgi:dTDP-4-amino-4,6-dideoxygalactose transaminase
MQGLKSFLLNTMRNYILSDINIPLSDVDYGEEEKEAVLRVLDRKWLSMGDEVQAFEQEFADFIGVRYAFAVSNATSALHLSLSCLSIKPEDEVIQPALNFVACANMTVALGAKPVFADILNLQEPTIDANSIEKLITPKTKAVVVMHYGGYPCRMSPISNVCDKHGIPIIEDACHAIGAQYLDIEHKFPHGKMVGNLSAIACFSFFSNKNLVTGEGGMVVTNNEDYAAKIKLLRSHGMTTLTWERHKGHASSYNVIAHGYNYRFDEIRAALGRVQLRKLANNNKRREKAVRLYHQKLSEISGWSTPFSSYTGDSSYHLMTLLAPNSKSREQIALTLKSFGIQTSFHYPCITKFKAFSTFENNNLPLSHHFANRVITLPLFPMISEFQIEQICSLICEHQETEE